MNIKIISVNDLSVLVADNGFISVSSTDNRRPYTGQPHTDQGERGKFKVHGLTLRDIADCVLKGMCYANPNLTDYDHDLLDRDEFEYKFIYDLDFSDVDPIAIVQNVSCEIEKRMGVFPNIEPTVRTTE